MQKMNKLEPQIKLAFLKWEASDKTNHIDLFLADIYAENPKEFHSSDSVHERIFYNEPRPGTVGKGFIVAAPIDHNWSN
jgi:hypothetical protein